MTIRPPLIGILGGMGPQAGLDLADKLITATATQSDQDHIPFILFSLPGEIPDRTTFLLGRSESNPAYAIADQFEKMSAMGITIAVMACNTAHAGPIFDLALALLREKGIKLRILHMVKDSSAPGTFFPERFRQLGEVSTFIPVNFEGLFARTREFVDIGRGTGPEPAVFHLMSKVDAVVHLDR